jgi:hypothetical protein
MAEEEVVSSPENPRVVSQEIIDGLSPLEKRAARVALKLGCWVLAEAPKC